MTTEHLTANDGTRLALHRVGDDAGAPVLLVPGAFSDNRFFTHPGILVSRAAREEVWPVVLDWIASVTA